MFASFIKAPGGSTYKMYTYKYTEDDLIRRIPNGLLLNTLKVSNNTDMEFVSTTLASVFFIYTEWTRKMKAHDNQKNTCKCQIN